MNTENDAIVIPLSKIKLFLMFLCSLAFISAGAWFAFFPPETARYNKYYLFVAGIAAIVFFGMCAAALSVKLFNGKPGLIINDEGITDNSGGVVHGFIPWTDITSVNAVKLENAANRKFILVYVRNPEEYINKHASFFSKKMKSANYKYYGTPITVSANGLKIQFDALWAVMLAEYAMFLDRKAVNR